MTTTNTIPPTMAEVFADHCADLLNLVDEMRQAFGELRRAKEELLALGCYVDEENPFAVYIPGSDESYAFRWEAGEQTVKRVLLDADAPVN